MKKTLDKKIILRSVMICLAAVMMIVIFAFSAQTASISNQVSDFFTNKVFASLGLSERFIRKAAHFTEFAVLGAFIMTFLSTFSLRRVYCAAISVSLCALYAAGDEFHQTFVSGRSGQISDVVLDTCGALFGVALACLVMWIISKKKKEKQS